MPEWLTAKAAMEYLHVSRSTFYKLIRQRLITPYDLAGTDEKRYRREDLDKLLKPAVENQERSE